MGILQIGSDALEGRRGPDEIRIQPGFASAALEPIEKRAFVQRVAMAGNAEQIGKPVLLQAPHQIDHELDHDARANFKASWKQAGHMIDPPLEGRHDDAVHTAFAQQRDEFAAFDPQIEAFDHNAVAIGATEIGYDDGRRGI